MVLVICVKLGWFRDFIPGVVFLLIVFRGVLDGHGEWLLRWRLLCFLRWLVLSILRFLSFLRWVVLSLLRLLILRWGFLCSMWWGVLVVQRLCW